ncbi:MAG: pyruvate kinase [Candidatus Zixiibacteriota bacterium]
MSNAKIICTVGPASEKPDVLEAMITAGMNIARLNFSHGTHDQHQQRLDVIRKLSGDMGREVRILADLEGLRIRIGDFKDKTRTAIKIKPKQIVTLSNQDMADQSEIIPLDYHGSLMVINPDDFIYIDDGNIALKVIDVTEQSVRCEVVIAGDIKEHKGINIPNADFPSQGLTKKDRRDLEFAIKNKVDFIAQSFVREKRDITIIGEVMAENNFECQLVSKIENKDGVKNLAEIIDVSDGIMIARGDLGVSLPIYEIPILQKKIIRICLQNKKIAITATQMLESMTENLRPTRAEVSDVANAVLDGTDYVMLSGETAVGKYPVETVAMMQKVIDYTEQSENNFDHF